MRYVALGDSYTIGTSVEPRERWPNQLVAALGPTEPTLDLVANLGVNGYTSTDLIRAELPALARLDPGFATLLIGVNDVVRRVPLATYERNVITILDALLGRLPADRIVAVATPDYTVTPAGADFGDPRASTTASSRSTPRWRAWHQNAPSPSWTSSTSRSGPLQSRDWSPGTGSTRAAPSTPAGWSGSPRSSRICLSRGAG